MTFRSPFYSSSRNEAISGGLDNLCEVPLVFNRNTNTKFSVWPRRLNQVSSGTSIRDYWSIPLLHYQSYRIRWPNRVRESPPFVEVYLLAAHKWYSWSSQANHEFLLFGTFRRRKPGIFKCWRSVSTGNRQSCQRPSSLQSLLWYSTSNFRSPFAM